MLLSHFWMSAEHTDNTIVNLKVLASLKSGERLSTRNNGFEICEASWFNSFNRRLQGDTRWINLDGIKLLLEDATRILNTYLSYAFPVGSGVGAESAYPSPTPETSIGFVRTMMTEMESAGRGLENLKETYTSDSRMLANLEVSLQKIRFETGRARHALGGLTAAQSQYIQQSPPMQPMQPMQPMPISQAQQPIQIQIQQQSPPIQIQQSPPIQIQEPPQSEQQPIPLHLSSPPQSSGPSSGSKRGNQPKP